MSRTRKTEPKPNGSLRDQILAADDLKREQVEVPEWGLTVWIRTMTAGERDLWEQWVFGQKDLARRTVRSALVAFTATDETGDRIFTDDDIEPLAAKSAGALSRLYNVATRLNLILASDVDELEKN